MRGQSLTVDGAVAHDKGTNLNKLRQKIGMVFQQWIHFPT
ncbi:ABC-type polar amino acid transport system ATPase subunit [Rhizobium mongolense]|uniref:ABC-type polar amino acid transport system ATPase subunit n=1 Tax=Rhizobium mongolense TaxID=57676 RepID=A0A7W6RKC9_9HYPH|nr:ABC-type polar amino acid transport system ATPase subunit [Rhizobium mongolense]